jgi:hypothetical protein
MFWRDPYANRRLIPIATCAVLALSVAAEAQPGSATLRGRVLDQQGAALPSVVVVATNQESGVYREVVSTRTARIW